MRAYVQSAGWTLVHKNADIAEIWALRGVPSAFEIHLPLDPLASGYPQRIKELLRELEAAEERSQLDIFLDMQSAACDVFRLGRSATSSRQISTLPGAAAMIEATQDILAAVTWSVVEPQPWFTGRRPREVTSMVESFEVDLSHDPSSVCILSKLEPSLFNGSEDEFVPFSRRVSLKLRAALDRLEQALGDSRPLSGPGWLEGSFQCGLSSNVCQSLFDLLQRQHLSRRMLDVSVRLSPIRPFEGPAFSRWSFRASQLGAIKEMGERLKAIASPADHRLLFLITAIETGKRGGKVRGVALFDDEARAIHFQVDEDLLRAAERARSENHAVRCQGRIRWDGAHGRYEVLGPHDLEIVYTEDAGIERLRRKAPQMELPSFQSSFVRERG